VEAIPAAKERRNVPTGFRVGKQPVFGSACGVIGDSGEGLATWEDLAGGAERRVEFENVKGSWEQHWTVNQEMSIPVRSLRDTYRPLKCSGSKYKLR